jgi:hypothetical protein
MRQIAFLFTIALLAAGCSAGAVQPPAIGQGSDMVNERNEEVARLSWPSGAGSPSFAPYPSGFMFEKGVGSNQADIAWVCAWSREWLATRSSDPTRANHALNELGLLETLPFYANLEASGRLALMDAIGAARSGDPEPLITQRTGLDCGAVA